MVVTRAQAAIRKGHASLGPLDQETRPKGIQKPRLARDAPKQLACTVEANAHPKDSTPRKPREEPSFDAEVGNSDPPPKRPQPSSELTPVQDTLDSPTSNHGNIDPIAFWVRQGKWPKDSLEANDMDYLLARKVFLPSRRRKTADSATSKTPSDQRPREEKCVPYRDAKYHLLLRSKGSYMHTAGVGITDTSKRLIRDLLDVHQPAPRETLFDETCFVQTCRNLLGKNEARVIQDISRLIVPSAEALAARAKHRRHLRHLTESVNDAWNNSIPLTGTRPQPDYSVGFGRDAFNQDQLAKLSPFIGDVLGGDQSLFMATYYMYFPFLACEVKCGSGELEVADRQNAHSMTLAARAVTELFRAVKCEAEVHREILAFSVSHDDRSVRIYGHYPVIDGNQDIKYYRHPIRSFDFTELDGREKWTAYRFTKNVYDSWMPSHFRRICSAIDQLPADLNFDDASLPSAASSRGSESHPLSPPDSKSTSDYVETASQSSSSTKTRKRRRLATPPANSRTAKKRRRGTC
ncbi:hypothetical protein NLG97_g5775 [Lecanicillium saksenae]|uniref:Uncharacterized protein n=1 Tax=Lecanicillium saksenae TaxID=468837 RepID=A0ACC1QUQ0_9HYPO|nr:hypothetical protein NLG97_g5775 [Lecanicillium saksenae]